MGFARDGCRISGGEIIFDGIDLRAASERERRGLRGKRIAYVAQSAAASFNPAHKLIDQYAEAPVRHHVMSRSEAEHDAVDLYRRMQLPNPEEIGFRYPHQVSGGQLQRAMTAMAMSCRPDLIIFDEPTTALDVTTQIEVLAAIRDIVEQFDTAAIYITHDLAVVAQMANRIKVLLRGEEVEEADTRIMLDAPTQDYTKSLWAVRSFTRPTQPPVEKGVTPVVSVRNVTAAYGVIDVLTNISFRHPRAPHRRRGGRIRLRQIDHGAGHHRPSAAAPGRDPVQRRGTAARLPPPHPRTAQAGADDLPDGGHGAEPQAQDPRPDRTARAECIWACRARRVEERIKDLPVADRAGAGRVYRPGAVGAFGRAETADRHRPRAVRRRAAIHHLRRGEHPPSTSWWPRGS